MLSDEPVEGIVIGKIADANADADADEAEKGPPAPDAEVRAGSSSSVVKGTVVAIGEQNDGLEGRMVPRAASTCSSSSTTMRERKSDLSSSTGRRDSFARVRTSSSQNSRFARLKRTQSRASGGLNLVERLTSFVKTVESRKSTGDLKLEETKQEGGAGGGGGDGGLFVEFDWRKAKPDLSKHSAIKIKENGRAKLLELLKNSKRRSMRMHEVDLSKKGSVSLEEAQKEVSNDDPKAGYFDETK